MSGKEDNKNWGALADWFSWSIVLYVQRSQARFLIRAHTQTMVLIPGQVHIGGNQLMFPSHILASMFFSFSLSLRLLLKINNTSPRVKIKKKKKQVRPLGGPH